MKAELIKYQTEYTVNAGAEALNEVKECLLRAIREIDSYTERYNTTDSLTDKANQLNYALNFVASSIIGNCRLDLLADRQAKLVQMAEITKNQ
jgi:hypothetical protein